jgi:hypothetical protein
MSIRTASLGVLLLACVAACSPKSPPAESGAAPATPPAAPPAQVTPTVDRGAKAAGMMELLDTAPNCQSFRDQLEAAGKTPADQPLQTEMSQIVAQAHRAGCTKKRVQQ